MENLLGVVLCGGQSTRMGTDKGLLIKDNKPWAVLIAEKLKDAKLPVIISINEKQQDSYLKLFPENSVIVDHLSIDGPLEGLLSVHDQYPDKDIFLMACDLVDMDQETISTLIQSYSDNPTYDYYVYQHEGFTQPFCAIYTSKALAKVYASLEHDGIKKYSLHDRFEAGNTMYIPIKNTAGFTNYNTL